MAATQSAAIAQAGPTPKINRNKTVSTKLTQMEYGDAQRAAASRGQWLSEWVRDLIVTELTDEQANFDLICEVVGLQLLLMNVLAPLVRGEKLTAEQFQSIVRSVQTAKVKAAAEMLSKRRLPKEK